MHSAHKRKWSLTEDAYLNFNPRTDAIYSQGIKKKIDIKISRPRKDYRESFAPCTGNGHQQYSRSTTRPFCDGHLSIREVPHSSLHITAAFLFSETPSLALLKAGRKSRADWVKRCLFRWHNGTLTLRWAQLTWHIKASDCLPSADSTHRRTRMCTTTNNPTVTDESGKETTKSDAYQRGGCFWHNRALKHVMVLPEVTISSPRTKRDRFASKSRRAGYLTAKAFWVTHYLAMVELTMVWGQSMVPAGLCCSLGKRDHKPCCSDSKPIPLPILFPENNTPLDIWEMKEQQNSVIPPNRGSMF